MKVGTNKRFASRQKITCWIRGHTAPIGPRQMVSYFKVILWAIFRSLASSYQECFACSAFIHNLVTFQCSCTEMMNVHVWQMWKQCNKMTMNVEWMNVRPTGICSLFTCGRWTIWFGSPDFTTGMFCRSLKDDQLPGLSPCLTIFKKICTPVMEWRTLCQP